MKKINYKDVLVLMLILLGGLLQVNKAVFADAFFIRMFISWAVILVIPGCLVISLVYSGRFEMLEKLLDHFISEEEYETCSNLVELIDRRRASKSNSSYTGSNDNEKSFHIK